MDELLPVILGALLGGLICYRTTGKLRLILSAIAVIASGAAATVFSGEYAESWVYLLLDLGEASLGLTFGIAIAHRLRMMPQRPRVGRSPLWSRRLRRH